MTDSPVSRIPVEDTFLLRTRCIALAQTPVGGRSAPLESFPAGLVPIRPYATAPWAEECVPPRTVLVIAGLRGTGSAQRSGRIRCDRVAAAKHVPLKLGSLNPDSDVDRILASLEQAVGSTRSRFCQTRASGKCRRW